MEVQEGVKQEDEMEWQAAMAQTDCFTGRRIPRIRMKFMETLKIDCLPNEVFVFTPNGDVKVLKRGSNPIDFAYSIHSAIGNRMIGRKGLMEN